MLGLLQQLSLLSVVGRAPHLHHSRRSKKAEHTTAPAVMSSSSHDDR
jgi:hypothetical protein